MSIGSIDYVVEGKKSKGLVTVLWELLLTQMLRFLRHDVTFGRPANLNRLFYSFKNYHLWIAYYLRYNDLQMQPSSLFFLQENSVVFEE